MIHILKILLVFSFDHSFYKQNKYLLSQTLYLVQRIQQWIKHTSGFFPHKMYILGGNKHWGSNNTPAMHAQVWKVLWRKSTGWKEWGSALLKKPSVMWALKGRMTWGGALGQGELGTFPKRRGQSSRKGRGFGMFSEEPSLHSPSRKQSEGLQSKE